MIKASPLIFNQQSAIFNLQGIVQSECPRFRMLKPITLAIFAVSALISSMNGSRRSFPANLNQTRISLSSFHAIFNLCTKSASDSGSPRQSLPHPTSPSGRVCLRYCVRHIPAEATRRPTFRAFRAEPFSRSGVDASRFLVFALPHLPVNLSNGLRRHFVNVAFEQVAQPPVRAVAAS